MNAALDDPWAAAPPTPRKSPAHYATQQTGGRPARSTALSYLPPHHEVHGGDDLLQGDSEPWGGEIAGRVVLKAREVSTKCSLRRAVSIASRSMPDVDPQTFEWKARRQARQGSIPKEDSGRGESLFGACLPENPFKGGEQGRLFTNHRRALVVGKCRSRSTIAISLALVGA